METLRVYLTARKFLRVKSLKEASAAVSAYRTATMIGSSKFTGGRVTDEAGSDIAHVSYNGRVWEPGAFPTPEIHV